MVVETTARYPQTGVFLLNTQEAPARGTGGYGPQNSPHAGQLKHDVAYFCPCSWE